MRKLVCAIIYWFACSAGVLAQPTNQPDSSQAVVKNHIKLEYQGQGYNFRAWFVQQRSLRGIPIWTNAIVADNGTINVDAGWNPVVRFTDGWAGLWLMGGALLNTADLDIISWKYDVFAWQEIGQWSFDQEWIYFRDTHKHWFRFFGYHGRYGWQTTGTILHDRVNLTFGPRFIVPFSKNKLEIYTGLWGVQNINCRHLKWQDVNGRQGMFFLRYTIKLKS